MTKKAKLIIISAVIVVSVVILFLIIVGVGIYKYKWQGNFVNKVVKIVPYPAAIVDGRIVRYDTWQRKVAQYQRNKDFYLQEQEVDLSSLDLPSDAEVAELALEDLIKNNILKNIARKAHIKVSNDEIEQAYHDLILSKVKKGEDTAAASLEKIYGMSIAEFKQQVIKEYVLKKKVENFYLQQEENALQKLARQRAEEVLAKAKQGEIDFADLARMYSEDSLALLGGEVGYIGRGEMIKEYEEAVWNLKKGEISDIISTKNGYYIVKVEDIRDNDGEREIKVRHIFIKIDIDKLLENQLEKAHIWRLVA